MPHRGPGVIAGQPWPSLSCSNSVRGDTFVGGFPTSRLSTTIRAVIREDGLQLLLGLLTHERADVLLPGDELLLAVQLRRVLLVLVIVTAHGDSRVSDAW